MKSMFRLFAAAIFAVGLSATAALAEVKLGVAAEQEFVRVVEVLGIVKKHGVEAVGIAVKQAQTG